MISNDRVVKFLTTITLAIKRTSVPVVIKFCYLLYLGFYGYQGFLVTSLCESARCFYLNISCFVTVEIRRLFLL
jgi:hypothetical protein